MTLSPRRHPVALALALLALLSCGCSKKKGGDEAAEPAAGESFYQGTVDALKQAGLAVTPFENAAARPYGAKECARGGVAQLDVLLCRFDGDASGKQKKLEQFISGAVSGAVRAKGPLALAVADRKKADLTGKSINKLLKTFSGGEATAKAGE
jgi:hypothetical protein